MKVKKILFRIWCFLSIIPAYVFGSYIKVMRKIAIWSGDDATKMAYNLILDSLSKTFTTFKL